jgi:hypothetical protein
MNFNWNYQLFETDLEHNKEKSAPPKITNLIQLFISLQ